MGDFLSNFERDHIRAAFQLRLPGAVLGLQEIMNVPLAKSSYWSVHHDQPEMAPQFAACRLIQETAKKLSDHVLRMTPEEFAQLMVPKGDEPSPGTTPEKAHQ